MFKHNDNKFTLKFNAPDNMKIVNDLIDVHDLMRCGKVDDGRIRLEILLNEMIFEWREHVMFPKTPSL